jgi:hypothetical protein
MAYMSDADIRNYVNDQKVQYNTPTNSNRGGQDYTIDTCSYPEGVGINPDLQHYITFFINVRGKSQFVKNGTYNTVGDVTGGQSTTLKDSSTLASAGGVQRAAELAFGAGLATGIASAVSKAGSGGVYSATKGFVQGTLGGTALGLGSAAIVGAAMAESSVLQTDKRKRLKDVITLAVQERPTVTYGVNYQDKDMGILGGFLTGQTSLSDSSKQNGELGASLALQIAKIPSLLPGFGTASLSDIVQFGSKTKTNPFREVFFEGIDYRKFNFRYKFMPKNKTEADSVYNIIDKFKEHMHPELSAGGYFYVYPSEFKIAYYYNNKENGYINRIADCALTDMTVDYGGEQFSSFDDGAPTEINLSLSFRELELLTKETIRNQGY